MHVPRLGLAPVFGDGSVVILASPGHTPGHQSLLVRLPRRAPVILSGRHGALPRVTQSSDAAE